MAELPGEMAERGCAQQGILKARRDAAGQGHRESATARNTNGTSDGWYCGGDPVTDYSIGGFTTATLRLVAATLTLGRYEDAVSRIGGTKAI